MTTHVFFSEARRLSDFAKCNTEYQMRLRFLEGVSGFNTFGNSAYEVRMDANGVEAIKPTPPESFSSITVQAYSPESADLERSAAELFARVLGGTVVYEASFGVLDRTRNIDDQDKPLHVSLLDDITDILHRFSTDTQAKSEIVRLIALYRRRGFIASSTSPSVLTTKAKETFESLYPGRFRRIVARLAQRFRPLRILLETMTSIHIRSERTYTVKTVRFNYIHAVSQRDVAVVHSVTTFD